jgi:hypothetical protein
MIDKLLKLCYYVIEGRERKKEKYWQKKTGSPVKPGIKLKPGKSNR